VAPDPVAVQVSVIIPCYNSSAYLPDAVASVLAQTLSTIEVIFVDDGSVDNTRELIHSVIESNPTRNMRLVCQTNGGVASARNRGIALARGQFILPLDADDMIDATMVEECANVLDAHSDVAVVYTDREDFGDINRIWPAGKYDLRHLRYFNQIGYCSMFRKSMWEEIGGYRVNVAGFDDWDFWLAGAIRGYQGRHFPKALLKHRRHRGSFLWRILDHYERLFAQIILNNADAYSRDEVAIAERYISKGEQSSLLRSSKFVFLSRYYQNYPTRVRPADASSV
jgi:glycosyltransferase involved in cell wall biosynthesis